VSATRKFAASLVLVILDEVTDLCSCTRVHRSFASLKMTVHGYSWIWGTSH